MKKVMMIVLMSVLVCRGGGSVVPVGESLYADVSKLETANGSLEVRFETSGERRMVIAYGRKYRKTRVSRDGTTEAQRELFKPRLARLSDNGRCATFEKLPPDYYDLVVIDTERMTIHEGLLLHDDFQDAEAMPPDRQSQHREEIAKSLGIGHGLIGRWEQFFDEKKIERVEFSDRQAGVFLQQMRLGQALAESGEALKGCIHSIDVVWVEQTRAEDNVWQVINRQQLYRDEIEQRQFFSCHRVEGLHGIRVGTRPKALKQPIVLP